MTSLIIIGLGLVGYGLFANGGGLCSKRGKISSLVTRSDEIPGCFAGQSQNDSGATMPIPFGEIYLNQPLGSKITFMAVTNQYLVVGSSNDRQRERERIVIIDLTSGLILGTIIVGNTL